SQAVGPDSGAISVSQSPVWGLGSVIAAEHPELQCTLVDLSAMPSAEERQALTDELPAGLGSERIALPRTPRLVPPLRRASRVEQAGDTERREVARTEQPFRIETHKPGILDNLELRSTERREPRAGEVEVEVEATGLNFMNVMSALGVYPGYPNGLGPL